ncbi:MAG: polysaccharide biosynthesis protein, partial [Caldisericaceae bacterium]
MSNLFKKVLRNRITLLITFAKLILDVVLYNIATIVAVLLRFDVTLNPSFIHIDDRLGLIENVIFIIFDLAFQLPLQTFEFVSVKEMYDIFVAVFLAKLIFYPFSYLLREQSNFSRGAYLASFVIAFLLIASIRIAFRAIYDYRKKKGASLQNREKNVIIIGAGDAGEKILREITSREELNYNVVGFVDDDRNKRMSRIHGVPVLGEIARLPYIVRMQKVEIAIFAMPSAPPETLQKVVSLLSSTNCEIRTLPALWEIVSGRISIADIKNVELEDLLPRSSIRLESTEVANYLKGKKVLITGAGGSIDSEISRQVVSFKPEQVILVGRGENRIFDIERELIEKKKYQYAVPVICDIRNREKVFRVFEQY